MSFNYAGINFSSAITALSSSMRMPVGFDDERVTLGDGAVGVDDFQVQGSRSFTRDPRLASFAEAAVNAYRVQPTGVYLRGYAPISLPMRVDEVKWCYDCGETKATSEFSPRKDTFDRKNPRCKDCENKRNRERYAIRIGHPPRPYVRRAGMFVTGYSTGLYLVDSASENFTTRLLDGTA